MRLNASIRRTRTQAELDEAQATRGGRRSRGTSRGRANRANATVARLTTQRNEEGTSTPSSDDDSDVNETLDEIIVAFPA